MTAKQKISTVVGVLILGLLVWQFGFFTRFNYLTAKIDRWTDSARIVTVGPSLHPCGVPCIGLKEKYGFYEHYVSCAQTGPSILGIKTYNAVIDDYLAKRNGEDWRDQFQAEMDLLIENDRLE
jgi:hypothetical protein